MTDPQPTKESPSALDKGGAQPNPADAGATKFPLDGDAERVTAGELTLPERLTADEQMALFEEDLKENDWGHQPC